MSLIVLIGVTGSGKTTVGRLLAQRYHLPLRETDDAVEERLGASMRTLVVGRDPHLAITAREEAERLLRLDEGIVTLGASQPLDSALPRRSTTRGPGVPLLSNSPRTFPRYHAEKTWGSHVLSASARPVLCSPS